MPTSLVSTGVQFPDSTIQTTAAGASNVVKISSTTVSSAVSAVNVTSGLSTSTYGIFLIHVIFPTISNGDTIGLQVSSNGGSTYATSGYQINGSADRLWMSVSSTSNSNSGYVWLFMNAGNTYVTGANIGTFGNNTGGTQGSSYVGGGTTNAIRFVAAAGSGPTSQSGNITGGTYIVYGFVK
jgi:hypothetical protein